MLVCAAFLGATIASVSAQGATYLVVIGGIGGEAKYRDAFHEWGLALVKAAVEKHGVPRPNVSFFAEQPERDEAWIAAKSTKENVEKALVTLAGKVSAGDRVFIVLIGHGSFQSGESRFNLPGPGDPSAEDFARLISGFRGAQVAFVHTGSASGEFTKALSGENRAVVTATKSGQERNESVFGRYFVQAYAGDAADVDKDGRISLLEAYNYARLEVEREYKDSNRILTEHAVLDDNGDKTGTSAPEPAKGDGSIAQLMFLGSGAPITAAPANASPALRALYEQKRKIEQQLVELRAKKATMDPAAYDVQLESLLVELAKTDEEIRKMEGRK
jgi:hypothetical protein